MTHPARTPPLTEPELDARGAEFWRLSGTSLTWRLIHSEEHPTRGEAMCRERWRNRGAGRDWLRHQLRDARRGC